MKRINGMVATTVVPRSAGWIAIGENGFIQQSRIVGIGSAHSAPIRRLLQTMHTEFVVVLTGGQRRETAVLLDSGHVVITALTLAEWQTLLIDE